MNTVELVTILHLDGFSQPANGSETAAYLLIYSPRMTIAHDCRAALRILRRSGWLPAVVVLMWQWRSARLPRFSASRTRCCSGRCPSPIPTASCCMGPRRCAVDAGGGSVAARSTGVARRPAESHQLRALRIGELGRVHVTAPVYRFAPCGTRSRRNTSKCSRPAVSSDACSGRTTIAECPGKGRAEWGYVAAAVLIGSQRHRAGVEIGQGRRRRHSKYR